MTQGTNAEGGAVSLLLAWGQARHDADRVDLSKLCRHDAAERARCLYIEIAKLADALAEKARNQ